MKKHRYKKRRKKSIFLWLAIDVSGMVLLITLLATGILKKEDQRKTLEGLLIEYMNYIPEKEYG